MTPLLDAFLVSTTLDETQALYDQIIEPLDAADTEAVCALIEAWTRPQAIANLLMFPSLLPPAVQFVALWRGLHEPTQLYYGIAASVGLGKLRTNAFQEEQAARIGQRLLELMAESIPLRAERASAALQPYLQSTDIPRLLPFLSYPNRVLRHNALAALLRLIEYAEVQDFFDAQLHTKQLTMASYLWVKDQLATIDPATDDATYRLNLLASGLTTPLLVGIPNLDETW